MNLRRHLSLYLKQQYLLSAGPETIFFPVLDMMSNSNNFTAKISIFCQTNFDQIGNTEPKSLLNAHASFRDFLD